MPGWRRRPPRRAGGRDRVAGPGLRWSAAPGRRSPGLRGLARSDLLPRCSTGSCALAYVQFSSPLWGHLRIPQGARKRDLAGDRIRRFYTRRVMLTAGVDIGGTKVFAVLVDEDGSICHRASHPTDPEAGTASIVLALDQLIGRAGPDDRPSTGADPRSSSGSTSRSSSASSSGPGAIG